MKKWNYVTCKKEALKYTHLSEFRKNAERAYKVSIKNGWILEFKSFLNEYKKPIKWTLEICKKEALKYKYRKEFERGSSGIYQACYRNGWLDCVCKHMNNPYDNRFKWNKEKCKKEALKYKYRKEFQINNYNAYASARHNGWLDYVCSHMKLKYKAKGYWNNINNCKKEALKYKTKTDFIKNSQHCYNMSLKNGYISEITKHMVLIGDRYNKCIYAYEFPDNHVYVGLTYNLNVRNQSRKYNLNDAVTIHIKNTSLEPIIKKLTDYIPVDMAIKLENDILKKYINDGWVSLNRRKTGRIGSSSPTWNYNRVKKLTKKYKNINEFMNDDIELFKISKRSGWIDSLF